MSDYIPEDTVALILKNLPVRSLLRFRCVCKGWKELIDSPKFFHDHLSLQSPRFIANCQGNEFLSVDPHTRRPFVDPLIPPVVSDGIGMLGTLHGVVCITDWVREFLIWNPSIRKSSIVTLPDEFRWEDYTYDWEDYYGFWIDPSTKEFKILLLLFFSAHDDVSMIENKEGFLYSSIGKGWRVIPPEDLRDWWLSYNGGVPVMVGEVAHWIGWHRVTNEQGEEQVAEAIQSFDFRLESFEVIDLPPSNSNCVRSVLCCWQGILSLMRCDDRVAPHRWDVYSRQEGNSWVKVLGFDICAPRTLVLWPVEGTGEMQGNVGVLARCGNELVICDTEGGCISSVKSGLNSYLVNMAYGFVESLLFP